MNDLLYFQNGPREMQGVEIKSDENVSPGAANLRCQFSEGPNLSKEVSLYIEIKLANDNV